MKEQWACKPERKIKTATWVTQTTGAQNFDLDREPDVLHKLGAVAVIASSIASKEIIENLERLGLAPRFRYKRGFTLFENWTTPDLTTSCSVLIDSDTDGYVEKVMADNAITDAEIESLIKDKLNDRVKYSFSLETCFDDGFRLVSMTTTLSDRYKDVIAIELGATDGATFLLHRNAVEKRSKEAKVLYADDADDIRAGTYYFENYKLGPAPELNWKPPKYRWWHMLKDIVLAIWSLIFGDKD